jgi:protein Tex
LSLRLNDTPQSDRGSRREPDKLQQGKRNPRRGRDVGRQAPNQATSSMADALRKAGFGKG